MPSTPARREVRFVLAIAGAGLAAVIVVAFAPWYHAADRVPDPAVKPQLVHLVKRDDGAAFQP
jgi:hypothetical protein